MALRQFKIPQMGESIVDAKIVKWYKKPGDIINEDEILLEIATDKVNNDIISEYKGIVKEIYYKEEDIVKIGEPVALIETNSDNYDYIPPVQELNKYQNLNTQKNYQHNAKNDNYLNQNIYQNLDYNQNQNNNQNQNYKTQNNFNLEQNIQNNNITQNEENQTSPKKNSNFYATPNKSDSSFIIQKKESPVQNYVNQNNNNPEEILKKLNIYKNNSLNFNHQNIQKTIENISLKLDSIFTKTENIKPKNENINIDLSGININKINNRTITPLGKKIAKYEGLTDEEINDIPSKNNFRITKNDIIKFIENTEPNPEIENEKVQKKITKKKIVLNEGDKLVKMSQARKFISKHMSESKIISPHAYSIDEIVMDNLLNFKNKYTSEFKNKNIKINTSSLLIYSIAQSIKANMMLNSEIFENEYVIRKNINIGIAAALENGDLVVPVLKNLEKLNFEEMNYAYEELVFKIKTGKLSYDDYQGGTFTISNIGTYNGMLGIPILNQPQSAIIAIGRFNRKPIIVMEENEEKLKIGTTCFFAVSHDHRILDGKTVGSFLNYLNDFLQNFDKNIINLYK